MVAPRPHIDSIDLIKCIAAILIVNSHMGVAYGKYGAMATGGAFGDALFFFCSGFTLFLGREYGFFNWYKRRIKRIFPTVFAWSLVSCLLLGSNLNMFQILTVGGGWFVSCIMIYYVILWFVRRYIPNRLEWVAVASVIFSLVWYFTLGTGYRLCQIYGSDYFKWSFFFLYMLFGAYCGKNYNTVITGREDKGKRFDWKVFAALVVSIALFFPLCSFWKCEDWRSALQLLSGIPLLTFVWCLWRLCETDAVLSLLTIRFVGPAIKFIGGLCLEIYLVHHAFLTDRLNFLFPLNIPLLFIAIIFSAYLLRCLSRIWTQTFENGDYDWKEVIKA